MSFHNADEIEQALRGDPLPVRVLHEIWQQRQPVPEFPAHIATTGPIRRQIPWIQTDPELAGRFTRRALERQEFQLVCDAAREILRYWQQDREPCDLALLRVRMNLAAALTRLGDTHQARGVLDSCLRCEPGKRLKAEVLQQLGGIERDEAQRVVDKASRLQMVETALAYYRQAADLEPEALEARIWVAAGTLYVAGEDSSRREEALARARHVLELAAAREDAEGPRFATLRARAEALVLLGKEGEALGVYRELGSVPGSSVSRLADARYRTRFLADALQQPRDFLKDAFPPLQLVVFAGHLPDRPGHPRRFPADLAATVRERLRAELAVLGAQVGFANAAAGGDLLFLDELEGRPDSRSHIVLPWSEEEFRRISLRPYEPGSGTSIWEPLFDKVIRQAASIRQIGEYYAPDEAVGWQYIIEATAGLALHTARTLRLDLQPLVLWDRMPGYGPGGTKDFHDFWMEHLGIAPRIVDMPCTGAAAARNGGGSDMARGVERSSLRQVVKSMLFADIVGYSKLREEAIPEFVTGFLGRVSQLAARSRNAPISVNTWGDAIYAVFDFAVDAGNFALELAQMIHDNRDEWLRCGLYSEERGREGRQAIKHPLNIRIGLHAGPVFMHYNPVVRQLGFTGAHVSRAARIEPITEAGEAFASEEFAALVEAHTTACRRRGEPDGATFVCEYTGTRALAKGYPGLYRIYRLIPTAGLDVEQLAKTIHRLYCEKAAERGQTRDTNAMMRPWEELSENIRDANREQAAAIPDKLRRLGYELSRRGGVKASEMTFAPDRLEELARDEHDRWVAERRRNGWSYGAVRDDARKKHPLLVDWDALPEIEKEKDRDPVRNLPALVEAAGFRMRKLDIAG